MRRCVKALLFFALFVVLLRGGYWIFVIDVAPRMRAQNFSAEQDKAVSCKVDTALYSLERADYILTVDAKGQTGQWMDLGLFFAQHPVCDNPTPEIVIHSYVEPMALYMYVEEDGVAKKVRVEIKGVKHRYISADRLAIR